MSTMSYKATFEWTDSDGVSYRSIQILDCDNPRYVDLEEDIQTEIDLTWRDDLQKQGIDGVFLIEGQFHWSRDYYGEWDMAGESEISLVRMIGYEFGWQEQWRKKIAKEMSRRKRKAG